MNGAVRIDPIDGLDRLLWLCSTARKAIPLIALSAVYDETEALTLFRMGVTDYLSLKEHREAIPAVIRSLVRPIDSALENNASDQSARERVTPRPLAFSQLS